MLFRSGVESEEDRWSLAWPFVHHACDPLGVEVARSVGQRSAFDVLRFYRVESLGAEGESWGPVECEDLERERGGGESAGEVGLRGRKK